MEPEFLKHLNPAQREAVTAPPGPLLVLAGPGSGKTRVLTYRIAYLIQSVGMKPYNILAVTFTNKAAREMKRRLEGLLGDDAARLSVGTFHALCARILRREAEHLPFSANFTIMDADDQKRLVRQVIRDLNLDDRRFPPGKMHNMISNAKNEGRLPQDIPDYDFRDKILREVYTLYQKRLLEANALDFDDLLFWTLRLFDEQPEVLERYSRRYRYVLVDEFQDTNMVQYELTRRLTSHYRNILVVGDIDQSIYSWRGADYRNVLRFERDYPDAKVVLLEQNYRSVQNILDAAMAVIAPQQDKHRKKLFTKRGRGEKIVVHEAENEEAEALFVVRTIAEMVARGDARPGDFAIMYRTNAQSRPLETEFLRAGLPYRLVGAQRFYGRREIKDLLAFMRLAYNPADEVSLMRIINVPPRRIGARTLSTLRNAANHASLSAGHLLLHIAESPNDYAKAFSSTALRALAAFGLMLKRWYELALIASPLDLLDTIIEDVHYKPYILGDEPIENESRWENVQELRRLAAEYPEGALNEFLEEVALVSDQDTVDDSENVPVLLTLHASKGLEFPIVFIVGLVEGVLPHARSAEEPGGLDEERRLLYVGITRAKDRLFLTYTRWRTGFGYEEPAEPSRFLEEIPPELTVGDHPLKGAEAFSAAPSFARWEPEPTPAPKPSFKVGMHVQHPLWGTGLIVGHRVRDGREIVDVLFDSVGLKRLDPEMARLEVV